MEFVLSPHSLTYLLCLQPHSWESTGVNMGFSSAFVLPLVLLCQRAMLLYAGHEHQMPLGTAGNKSWCTAMPTLAQSQAPCSPIFSLISSGDGGVCCCRSCRSCSSSAGLEKAGHSHNYLPIAAHQVFDR